MNNNELPIKVLLIEQISIANYGLEILINKQQPLMKVIGSFNCCLNAIPTLENLSPDIILLDIDLYSEKESQAALQLIAMRNAKILILKWTEDSTIYDKAILAGANGILEKDVALNTILKAIKKVHEGQLWLDQAYLKKLISKMSSKNFEKNDIRNENKLEKLTPKEKTIFFTMTMIENATLPAKVIANKLNIRESTLRNHLTSIYEKLEVANKLQLWNFVNGHK